MYKIMGTLKSANGRRLNDKELGQLAGLTLKIVARRIDSVGPVYSVILAAPYDYQLSVPYGFYSITVDSSRQAAVSSKPVRYRSWITQDRRGMHFAIQIRRQKLN